MRNFQLTVKCFFSHVKSNKENKKLTPSTAEKDTDTFFFGVTDHLPGEDEALLLRSFEIQNLPGAVRHKLSNA